MDPITCCLLGICCPPGSAEQMAAFESVLAQHLGDADKAKKAAKALAKELRDLTEKIAKYRD